MNAEGVGLALTTAILYAVSPVFYGLGSKGLSGIEANALRSITLLPLLYVFYISLSHTFYPIMSLNAFLACLIVAVLWSVLADTFFIASINYIGPSLALTFSNLYPVVAAYLSIMFLGERPGSSFYPGLTLILGGFILAYGVKGGESNAKWWGLVLALAASAAWGGSIAYIKLILREVPPLNVLFVRYASSALILAPFATIIKHRLRAAVLLAIGGFTGLLGFYTLLLAIGSIGASASSAISSVSPLITPLIALRIGESLSLREAVGIVSVTLGVALVILST